VNKHIDLQAATQHDFQQELLRMRQQNYPQFRPQEYRDMLLAYFYYLEREVKGGQDTDFPDAEFSAESFEEIIHEAEVLLVEIRHTKHHAAAMLTVLADSPCAPTPPLKTFVTAVLGDITRQPDCQAIVNAANTQLRKGGGVCGAIHRAAGSQLEVDALRLAPVAVGEARITSGHHLPNRWVIHAVGPRYAIDPDPAALLATALRNALVVADSHQVTRIAIPAISTGVYGYPMAEAASVLIATAHAMAPQLRHVVEIRFVLFSADALTVFSNHLKFAS